MQDVSDSHSIPLGYYRLPNDKLLITYSFTGSATVISGCQVVQIGSDYVFILKESLVGDILPLPESGFLENGNSFIIVTAPQFFNKLYLGKQAHDRELLFLGLNTGAMVRTVTPHIEDPFSKPQTQGRQSEWGKALIVNNKLELI
jgi:hypothetical protein